MVEKIVFTLQESYRHIIFLPLKSSLYLLSLSLNHFLSTFLYTLYININSHHPYDTFLFLLIFFSFAAYFFINIKFIRDYLKLNHNEIKLVKKLKANPAYIRKPLILTSLIVNFTSLLLVINLTRIFYNRKKIDRMGSVKFRIAIFHPFSHKYNYIDRDRLLSFY